MHRFCRPWEVAAQSAECEKENSMLEHGADCDDKDKVMIGCVGRQTVLQQSRLRAGMKR